MLYRALCCSRRSGSASRLCARWLYRLPATIWFCTPRTSPTGAATTLQGAARPARICPTQPSSRQRRRRRGLVPRRWGGTEEPCPHHGLERLKPGSWSSTKVPPRPMRGGWSSPASTCSWPHGRRRSPRRTASWRRSAQRSTTWVCRSSTTPPTIQTSLVHMACPSSSRRSRRHTSHRLPMLSSLASAAATRSVSTWGQRHVAGA